MIGNDEAKTETKNDDTPYYAIANGQIDTVENWAQQNDVVAINKRIDPVKLGQNIAQNRQNFDAMFELLTNTYPVVGRYNRIKFFATVAQNRPRKATDEYYKKAGNTDNVIYGAVKPYIELLHQDRSGNRSAVFDHGNLIRFTKVHDVLDRCEPIALRSSLEFLTSVARNYIQEYITQAELNDQQKQQAADYVVSALSDTHCPLNAPVIVDRLMEQDTVVFEPGIDGRKSVTYLAKLFSITQVKKENESYQKKLEPLANRIFYIANTRFEEEAAITNDNKEQLVKAIRPYVDPSLKAASTI